MSSENPFMRGYIRGQALKRQSEQDALDAEDRKANIEMKRAQLKLQQLEHDQKVKEAQKAEAAQYYNLLKGQPAPTTLDRGGGITTPALQTQGAPVPSDFSGTMGAAPAPQVTTPLQNPEVTFGGFAGRPDLKLRPPTAEQLLMERKKAALEEAQLKSMEPYTLAEGGQRYAGGQKIAENPKDVGATSEPKPATSIQEYMYYVDQETKQGRKPLSYDAYQEREANRRRQPVPAGIQLFNLTQPTAGMDTSLSDALLKATFRATPSQRATIVKTVNDQVNRGDITAAKASIKQAAVEGESQATRAQIMGRRELAANLIEIDTLLKQVDPGLLVGTLEDTARRLGRTTNPALVKVGTRLLALNQSYRKAVTGAQFSAQESAEYQKLLPGYSNTSVVNRNLIDGLMESIRTNDNAYWNPKLGPGWSDFPSAAPTAPAAGGWKIIGVK